MQKFFTGILLLAVLVLLQLRMAGEASARPGFIWIPHGGHYGGLRGGASAPRLGVPAARFGRYGGGYPGAPWAIRTPRIGPGRYGTQRYGGVVAGPRFGAYGRYGRYPYGGYGRYPYGDRYADRYWRKNNGYWGYPWGAGLGVVGLGLWNWGYGGEDYPGYYEGGYGNGDYTAVPSGGIGLYCQTPVRTCLLINPSDVGSGCSCHVPGGRARGVVVP
jgi:hypothetical protein